MTEMTTAEVASGVEYADIRLYAETCPCGATVMISDHSHDNHWNPWAPYPTYDAYHAASKAIADVLGWVEAGHAVETAKQYGRSGTYTGLLTGNSYVVTWDAATGAAITQAS